MVPQQFIVLGLVTLIASGADARMVRGLTFDEQFCEADVIAIGTVSTKRRRYMSVSIGWFERRYFDLGQLSNVRLIKGDLNVKDDRDISVLLDSKRDWLNPWREYNEVHEDGETGVWLLKRNQYEGSYDVMEGSPLGAFAEAEFINRLHLDCSKPAVNKRRARDLIREGRIYFQKGQFENAKNAWKSALSLDPDAEEAKQGLAKPQLEKPGKSERAN